MTRPPTSSPSDRSAGTAPWPSPLRAWYAVAILTLALVLSFVDRQILALLVEPIKRDLGVSDTEMSLLLGTSFAIFYVVAGVPIARLADRRSRRFIIGAGVLLWSIMTMGCGLVRQYWQLFSARVGVGVGEAALSPAALSMISDLFPPARAALPTSVFHTGSMFGSGLALLLGGVVVSYSGTGAPVEVPLLGMLYPWQFAIIVVGAPGVAVAALLATVREPTRRGRTVDVRPNPEGARDLLRFMWDARRTFLPIFLALAIKSFKTLGVGMWIPAFFMRVHGWSAMKVGLYQGILLLTVAPLGMVCGGWLAGLLSRRGDDASNVRVVLIGMLLIIPPSVAFPLVSSDSLAFVLSGIMLFIASLGPGPGAAALQRVSPNRMRAQVLALQFLVLNLVGYGLGPTAVALFTDFVFADESALGLSIACVSAILGPVGAWLAWLAVRPYGRMVRELRAREQEGTSK